MENEVVIARNPHRLMVFDLGKEIMRTMEYVQGLEQMHHLGTSVSKHSFRVALLSVRLADLLAKIGVKLDRNVLVRASLMHDFGILGRFEGKFKGIKGCCLFQHPKDSVEVAGALVHDLSDREINAIASHMWPFAATAPKYAESWVVNLSDKVVGTWESVAGALALVSSGKRKTVTE